jgi:hypothetical protein
MASLPGKRRLRIERRATELATLKDLQPRRQAPGTSSPALRPVRCSAGRTEVSVSQLRGRKRYR